MRGRIFASVPSFMLEERSCRWIRALRVLTSSAACATRPRPPRVCIVLCGCADCAACLLLVIMSTMFADVESGSGDEEERAQQEITALDDAEGAEQSEAPEQSAPSPAGAGAAREHCSSLDRCI